MKFRRANRHAGEVNAGALTDIMFFLLMFFLLIATMTNKNVIDLFLPQGKGKPNIDKSFVTVTIHRDLKHAVDGTDVDTLQLADKIIEKVAEKKEKTIVLQVEKGVPVEYMVRVLDVGVRKDLKVVLETEKAN